MNTKILAVDDSTSMRKVISFFLQRAGYQVREAANGQEALEMASHEEFNLVLTDIQMPVMDGFELTRRLRDMECYRGVPILTLTTLATESAKQEGKSAGATGWLVKPFGEKTLLATVKRLIH